jgi:hypothetical protein
MNVWYPVQIRFRDLDPLAHVNNTCYFIACTSATQAALIASILNDPLCLGLINTLIFWDAKRPVTKKLLQRVDLKALLIHLDRSSLIERATIELQRAGIEVRDKAWPDDLGVFLDEQFGKTIPAHISNSGLTGTGTLS